MSACLPGSGGGSCDPPLVLCCGLVRCVDLAGGDGILLTVLGGYIVVLVYFGTLGRWGFGLWRRTAMVFVFIAVVFVLKKGGGNSRE